MSQSVSDLLRAAESASKRTRRSTGSWHQVCVCGHLARDHGSEIGGDVKDKLARAGRVQTRMWRLTGCCGQPTNWKVKKQRGNRIYFDTDEYVDDPERPGEKVRVAKRYVTCPCPEFRAVLEVFNPGARFKQWAPVNPPRSGKRDYDPIAHPLMRGLKATKSELRNALVKDGTPERELEAKVDEQLAEIVRWLPDGQRCWTPNCSSTAALPRYVDGDDLSEMRCAAHAPYS